MAEATLASLDPVLKEVYGPRMESQIQNEQVTAKRIESTSEGVVETVGGKYVDFPVHVRRNSGIGARLEGEALPVPGRQGYAEVHVPLRYLYGVGRITAQAMQLANNNTQAFVSALDEEMDRLKNDVAKDYAQQFHMGSGGLVASVTADGANTVTVDTVQYLEMGEFIDIRNRTTGAAIVVDREITAINTTTNVVTYSGADGAAAATDGIYRAGNYAGGSIRTISGLQAQVSDTGILHGLDPTVEPKWKSIVNANGGTPRALSEGLMIKLCDDVRVQGGKVSAIFTSLGVRRAYFNLLTQQRRYVNTKDFAGGISGLPFNYGKEIPVVEDPDARPNRMYFLDESSFKVYRNKPWHWADEDKSIFKWISGYDSFTFYVRQFCELGTRRRNSNARLDDLTEG